MRYKTLIDDRQDGPDHDPFGPSIQVHELDDGSATITFSDEIAQELDWQVGDYLTWEIADDGQIHITNRQANARQRARDFFQDTI